MFTEMVVVTTIPYSNGNSIALQCIAGRLSNRNILSNAIAEKISIETGKTYLLEVKGEENDQVFGSELSFTVLRELKTGDEIAEAVQQLYTIKSNKSNNLKK